MFACILLNPVHVQVILWNPQVKMSRNQVFRATSRPEERFPLFSHPFSHCPCAWSRIMTLHLIMSLHQREREPMKPVQCACKHDICSVICDPNSTLWAQLLSATRYVKKYFDLLNPPRHGLHGRFEKDGKVCLKTSPKSHPHRPVHTHIFKFPRSHG